MPYNILGQTDDSTEQFAQFQCITNSIKCLKEMSNQAYNFATNLELQILPHNFLPIRKNNQRNVALMVFELTQIRFYQFSSATNLLALPYC